MSSIDPKLGRSRFSILDLFSESLLSILSNPGRSLLTAIGTILGCAAFVATLGISSTLTGQISKTFDLRHATEVVIKASDTPDRGTNTNNGDTPTWQSAQALTTLRHLNGVEATGSRLVLPEKPVRRLVTNSNEATKSKIIGADPDALDVIEPRIEMGRRYNAYHEQAQLPVVMLSHSMADQLEVTRVGVAIFVEDQSFTVIGIYDDVQRRTESLTSMMIPVSVATAMATRGTANGDESPQRDVIVKVKAGAAQLIGSQATVALLPSSPDMLQTEVPPHPRTLRREIEGSVAQLSIVISMVVLAIGTVSIGNASTAGIAARTPEIGLRRALGAGSRHIFFQLIGETSLLGAMGGCVGSSIGTVIVVVTALMNRWTPIIDLRVALVAAGGGVITGLIAGLIPAIMAVRIPPVAALQR